MARVRKAIVPVAGFGTRMYPATRAVKKEFFPIVDASGRAKPIVQLIIEEAVDAGIEEICLITQPGDESVFRDYFDNALPAALDDKLHRREWARVETERLRQLSARLVFVPQPSQEGFGHAVHCCRDWVGGEASLLMLGDHLYASSTADRCAAQLLAVARETDGSVVAVERSEESQLRLCGTVGATERDGPVYDVTEFVEKPDIEYARTHLAVPGDPTRPYFCVFGQYVLSPAVFDALDHVVRHDIRENGEIQFTGALDMARREDGGALAYVTRGRRFDTGVPAEYVRTVQAFGGGI